jgi:HNH endonuclease
MAAAAPLMLEVQDVRHSADSFDGLALVRARFLARLERCSRTASGCLLWVGAKTPTGYGKVAARLDGRVVTIYTHRLAFEAKVGRSILAGLEINHICNTPSCVEPSHLEEVTRSENMRHMMRCGRGGGQIAKGHRNETRWRRHG